MGSDAELISPILQEGSSWSNELRRPGHLSRSSTVQQPSLLTHLISPLSKELASESRKTSQPYKGCVLSKPESVLPLKHLRRPKANRKGPGGLPGKDLLVLKQLCTNPEVTCWHSNCCPEIVSLHLRAPCLRNRQAAAPG